MAELTPKFPDDRWIDALIDSQPLRHSLGQAFYTHPAIFERDRDRIF